MKTNCHKIGTNISLLSNIVVEKFTYALEDGSDICRTSCYGRGYKIVKSTISISLLASPFAFTVSTAQTAEEVVLSCTWCFGFSVTRTLKINQSCIYAFK